MARVPYTEFADASPKVKALYDFTLRLTGRLANYGKMMAHVPWLLKWMPPLSMAVQREERCLLAEWLDEAETLLAAAHRALADGVIGYGVIIARA